MAVNLHWVGGTATWNATVGTKWALTSGGVGGQPIPTTADAVFFDSGGGGTVTIGASAACASLDCTGADGGTNFTGTLAGSTALAISAGAFTLNGTMGFTYTGTLTFADTSGTTRNITTAGQSLRGITINGVGGVFQLGDALTIGGSATLTVTNGSFLGNGKTIIMPACSSSGAAVRTVDLTNCDVTVSGAATPWTFTTITNLTFVSTGSSIHFTNSAGTGKTFQMGGLTYNDVEWGGVGTGSLSVAGGALTIRDLKVSNTGGATWTPAQTLNLRDFNFTGFTGTYAGTAAVKPSRHATFVSTMTITATGVMTMTGTGTLTSGTRQLLAQLLIDATGGTVTLADALDIAAAASFGIKNGTFDTASKAIACTGTFVTSAAGSSTRTIALGSSIITLTGAGSVWNASNVTDLTFTANAASEIRLTESTAAAKTFIGGGLAYGKVTFAGSGTGVFTVTDSNTVDTYKIETPPHTVNFQAASTQTLTGAGLDISGTAGNLNVIASGAAGTQFRFTKAANDVLLDYITVQDAVATGGARWFAGIHSSDVANSNGWRYTGLYRSP